jgi:hypothetical protein
MGVPNRYLHINFGRNRLVNKNFRATGVSKRMSFPTFPLIIPSIDPFFWSIDYCDVGGPNRYLRVKFGRNRLINKNFRAREMSKNVIFLTFFPIAPLLDPFPRYFGFSCVERHKHYFPIKFGRNPLVNKNVRVPGVSKNRKFPILGRSDPFFSTSHRRHPGRAPDNLPINFGENRLVIKNFSFLGFVRPLFPKFSPAT